MRLKRNRLRDLYVRSRETIKDSEGGTYESYADAIALKGEVWQAGGKVQTELYGERISYIQNIKLSEKYTIETDKKGKIHYVFCDGTSLKENDGVCLFVEKETEPDYRIISIKPYRFLTLEVEKL